MPKPRTSTRSGLTVIELLATSALAALLMMAVLSTLGMLAKQRRGMLERTGAQPWRAELGEQLMWDFINAQSMQWHATQLSLLGFGSRDFASGIPTHRPTEVIYSVQSDGQRSWLVRSERHLDEWSHGAAHTELVCVGVTGLEVQPLGETSRLAQRSEGVIPDRLRLLLHGDSNAQPVLDKVMYLR